MLETTADEVVNTFMVTPLAAKLFHRWRNNPDQRHVTDFVMNHRTRVLYTIRPEDVRRAAKQTVHALARIRSDDIAQVKPIRDWRPDFAFTHVLHYALEATEALPTYQGFRKFCENDDRARAMLWTPSRQIIETVAAAGKDDDSRTALRIAAHDALRWRVGNAYYSFLREVYTIAVLRAEGHAVQAHPLADAVFRADAWIGRTVLSLYIGNAAFRNKGQGRKIPVSSILAGADPAFICRDLRLNVQHSFGDVHLPAEEQIRRLGWSVIRVPGLGQPDPPA